MSKYVVVAEIVVEATDEIEAEDFVDDILTEPLGGQETEWDIVEIFEGDFDENLGEEEMTSEDLLLERIEELRYDIAYAIGMLEDIEDWSGDIESVVTNLQEALVCDEEMGQEEGEGGSDEEDLVDGW